MSGYRSRSSRFLNVFGRGRAPHSRLLTGAAIAGLLAASAVALAQPWGAGWGGGMMGGMGGMMGGGMGNWPVTPGWGGQVLDYRQAQAFIRFGNEHGKADARTNTVTFERKNVTIDLVAVQPGFDDQTFELHGLTNPTIVVPRDADVRFNLLNMDYGNNMQHTVTIVPTPPPYPYMAMMYLGPPVVPPLPELPWRSADNVKQAQFAALGNRFIANIAGTYWYVCPTPQHASKGMYGRFVVR